MKCELEGRDDTEIAASATEAPEEIGVVVLIRLHKFTRCQDDVGGTKIVKSEPMLSAKPAEAAAKSQPGNTRGRIDTHGHGQTKLLRLSVEIAKRSTRLDSR